MADDPKVTEFGAGTASRAVTASASASFPTPTAGSPSALAHPPGGAPLAKVVPAKRRGVRRFVVPVLILAALGYGGKTAYDYFVEGRFLVSTDDAYVGADTSIIAAKAMGHLTAVPVVDNQVVHKGDLLAAIDDGDYQNAVDASRARIGTQDATIARFARQIDAQGAIIAQAGAQVDSAAAQAKSAAADVERAALERDRSFKLAQTNFGSQQRLEQATADRDRTVAALAAAKASQASAAAAFDGAKANLDVLKAQKDEAARQRNELVTALAMAQRNLSFTRVLAPFDGTVGNKAAQVGNLVQPGTRLMALVPLNDSYVDANFKETQLGEIKPGQRADVAIDALDGKVVEGVVSSISPASGAQFSLLPPDNATGNFTKVVQRVAVRITFPEEVLKQVPLRSGLSVIATIHTRDPDTPEADAARRPGARSLGHPKRQAVTSAAPAIRPGGASPATDLIVAPAAVAQRSFSLKRVAAFIFMVFGMFMAILDIQIVSASLSQIQAGLSASSDEITWVQTSYLVAEVIMIPLSGFLSRMVSTRVIFTISAGGFTLMSFMCAHANSIEEMILWRALQGFIGGGMIPTVFASAFTIFPRDKQPFIAPIIGLVATLAPTIGPTVGGYLTDWFSWHWLFLVNLGPGIIVTAAAWLLIDFDEPDYSLLTHFDYIGLITMAGFLGAMEYALEEGPSKDWFESQPVAIAIVISAVSGIVFFWRMATARQPIVDLSAFRDRNFWTGTMFAFVLGIGLYGLTYIYPVYLAVVRGYSSLMIGKTMFVTGLCMFFTAPLAGRLMTRVDPRLMIAAGFILFAIGTFQASYVTVDWDFWELLWPQVFRGVGLMLSMVPINNLALGTMPPQKIKNASGLFNLMRNLGGAVGLALINTLLDKRMDLHLERLRESVTWGRQVAMDTLASMTAALAARGSDAELAATRQLALIVRRQAEVMALSDVFLTLTVVFLGCVGLAALMRRPVAAGGGGGH